VQGSTVDQGCTTLAVVELSWWLDGGMMARGPSGGATALKALPL
jgi:hypothetical protein